MMQTQTIITYLVALVVSPLFAGVGYGIAFYFQYPNDVEKLVAHEGLFHLIGPNVYITSLAYGVTTFLGIPGYLLLKKFGCAKGWCIIIYGVLIGVCLSIIFSELGHWSYIVFPSFVVSSIAVLILSSSKFNKFVNKDPQGNV